MRLFIAVALFFSVPVPIALAQSSPEILLVGLFIDKSEKDPIDALKIGEDYYIPFETFTQAIAIKPTQVATGWAFETPIGKSILPRNAIKNYQDKNYLNIAATKAIGIPVVFNQSQYAIGIYPPWNQKDIDTKKPTKKAPPVIDYYPSVAGLNQITINGGINHQSSNNNKGKLQKNIQIGMAGHAFGGLWGGVFDYNDNTASRNHSDNKKPVDINRLYWATFAKQTAIRIGTNANPSFDTGGGESFSGVSVAYSNRDIGRHLSTFNQYNNSLLQNSFNDYRTISGQGPSGGVAELRVNGRGVARVRIGLDKYYEFTNLNLNQLYDAEYNIEVALYEHNFANQPLEVIPYNLGKRRSNVATGELLIEGGAGKLGNILKKDTKNNNTNYYYGYAEYGLHNNIALRAGINKTEQLSTLLGANIGLSPSINWDIAYRKQPQQKQVQSTLSYEGQKIGANYQFSYQKNDNQPKKIDKKHALYLYFRPTDAINLSVNAHRNQQTQKAKEQYFTVNANIRLSNNLYASLNRDRYSDMSYQLNWNVPEYKTNFAFSSNKYQYGLSVDHQLLPELRIGAAWKRPKQQQGDWYKGYLEYQVNDNSKLFANITRRLSTTGYQIGWQQRINNGFDFSVGYQRSQNQLASFDKSRDRAVTSNRPNLLDEQNYFYLQFNLSLMHVPGSGYQFGQSGSNNDGRIIANIDYDKDLPIDNKNISLKVNGNPTQATQLGDNNYLIENLKPGVYQIGIDNKDLPIEYNTETLPQFNVKVAKAATTVVPYYLQKRFGFSGKIQGISDSSKAVTVDIYQGDTKVTSVQSNDFGYYQVLGLKAGDYIVKTKGYRNKTVKLIDNFLFEIDLHK